MKHNRFFSILTVAVVLSLLILAIPAIPASAASVILLDVEKGQVGDDITIEGSGFTPSVPPDQLYNVDIYFSSDQLNVGDDINYYNHYYKIVKPYVYTDETGSFSKVIEIPAILDEANHSADVQGGTYYFYITYGGHEEIKAYAEFTVIGISEVSPALGPVGTEVEISGVGFDADDDVQMFYDGNSVDVSFGDRRIKPNGSFDSRVEIPESTAGEHTLMVEDEGGHSDQFQFTVEPKITLSPAPASSGAEVTITGTGFGEDADIFVYFDGDVVYITGDYDTNDCGSLSCHFIVPEVTPGTYLVEVEDDIFNLAIANLEVGPGIAIEPATSIASPASVGDTVTISGTGFIASHDITITYTSEPVVFTTTSLADGSFEYSFTVPPSVAGEHTVSVTDTVSTKVATFFVESTAPSAPTPLLPEVDDKVNSDVEFSWEAVTDPSLPVTYELQIATNNQFTIDSVLVSKIALTTSSYTLSEDEELESTGEEAPYYWRVRAKDAASNVSEWTSGRAFTVGGFSMPTWLIWTLVAIGVAGLFIVGIWLGRRSAASEDYW